MRRLFGLDDQTEVKDHDLAFVRDHDIGGFQISMDDVFAMQRQHACNKLCERTPQASFVESVARPDVGNPIDPFDQVHCEEPLVAVGFEGVETDQVRMVDVGGRSELLLELREGFSIDFRQQLQRHTVPSHDVDGFENNSHSSLA